MPPITRRSSAPSELPCTGVFFMDAGKIWIWRDYFDMGTYARAFA